MTVIEKLYAGVKLDEFELKQLAYEMLDDADAYLYEPVDEIDGEETRWHRVVQTIFKIQGDLWAISWLRGLTECQEDEFWDQPYKVVRKTRTIAQTYYEAID